MSSKRTSRSKHPRGATQPDASKQAFGASAAEVEGSYIRWKLRDLDFEGPFGWHKLQHEGVARVHRVLGNVESMTWAEASTGGDPLKCEKVSSFSKDAKQRLVEIGQGDLDDLWRFKCGPLPRVWGRRVSDAFHVLWWDPDHLVTPSHKKHT